MSESNPLSLLRRRRDGIRDWLDEEAPYTAADQKHLDSDTPERAYWHHGYQAALTTSSICSIRSLKNPAARTFPTSALRPARMHPIARRPEVVEKLAFLRKPPSTRQIAVLEQRCRSR